MKLSKRQLNLIIERYLKEHSEDILSPLNPKTSSQVSQSMQDSKTFKTLVDKLWKHARSNPSQYHIPVYSFLRYLAGESSDMTEEEIRTTKNGSEYLSALGDTLDNVALPYDGTYKDGNLKNGYAFEFNDKATCFYVLNYYGHWGPKGQGAMATEWLNALYGKGEIGRHWGPTLGKSGKGGRQIVETGIDEVMFRPDFTDGYHIIDNEFDFVRMISGQDTTSAEQYVALFKDLMKNLDQSSGIKGKLEAGLSWLAGRGLNSANTILELEPTPFKFNFRVKSKIKEWPGLSQYPIPNSIKDKIGKVKGVEALPGQKFDTVEKKSTNKKQSKNTDRYDDASPGAFF